MNTCIQTHYKGGETRVPGQGSRLDSIFGLIPVCRVFLFSRRLKFIFLLEAILNMLDLAFKAIIWKDSRLLWEIILLCIWVRSLLLLRQLCREISFVEIHQLLEAEIFGRGLMDGFMVRLDQVMNFENLFKYIRIMK